MANLQVKDFPQELYDQLTALAKDEKRSISQQTIHIIEKALKQQRLNRRKKLLKKINKFASEHKFEGDHVKWIREDRDA